MTDEYTKRERLLIAQLKEAQEDAEHWKTRWATRDATFDKLRELIREVLFMVGDWEETPDDD